MAGLLEDKIALITGGNSGIGSASALAFAREGARVIVAARRVPEGEDTVRRVQEAGSEAVFVRADVTKGDEVEALVAEIVGAYGRLDCAFNNAGTVGAFGATADCTPCYCRATFFTR